jgi:hypothetical protein
VDGVLPGGLQTHATSDSTLPQTCSLKDEPSLLAEVTLLAASSNIFG